MSHERVHVHVHAYYMCTIFIIDSEDKINSIAEGLVVRDYFAVLLNTDGQIGFYVSEKVKLFESNFLQLKPDNNK